LRENDDWQAYVAGHVVVLKSREALVFEIRCAGNYDQRFCAGVAGGDRFPLNVYITEKLAVRIVAVRSPGQRHGDVSRNGKSGVVVVIQLRRLDPEADKDQRSGNVRVRRETEWRPFFRQCQPRWPNRKLVSFSKLHAGNIRKRLQVTRHDLAAAACRGTTRRRSETQSRKLTGDVTSGIVRAGSSGAAAVERVGREIADVLLQFRSAWPGFRLRKRNREDKQ
jgi:hypothetical protein